MKPTFKLAALMASGYASLSPLAQAAWTFESADLVLAVQATSGTGSTSNLFFNLGPTTGFLSDGAQGFLGNINNDMAATFGANWYDREDLWFGVAGVRSNLSPALDPGAEGEEPGRTWYVGSGVSVPGSALPRPAIGSTGLGNGATKFGGFKDAIAGLAETAFGDGVAILDQNLNPVGWNNSWTTWNPTPGASFDIFSGGVQNNFGSTDDTVWVDVQRMVAGSSGTYVTSIGFGADGSIVAVPEPTSMTLAAFAGLAFTFRRRRQHA